MNEKKIKPWKGGRTERLAFRVTPAVKRELFTLAEKHGCSASDVLVLLLEAFKATARP